MELVDEMISHLELNNEIKSENKLKNDYVNASVKETLRTTRVFIIIGWCLSLVTITLFLDLSTFAKLWCVLLALSGYSIIAIGSIISGIQFIRQQKLAHGICMMIFGTLSLGIWPFIAINTEIKKKSYKEIDVTSNEFINSTLKGYDVAKILLIVGLSTCIFIFGLYVILVGCYFVAIQDFRHDKLSNGVCILIFGIFTLGIWPLVYTLKQCKNLKQ